MNAHRRLSLVRSLGIAPALLLVACSANSGAGPVEPDTSLDGSSPATSDANRGVAHDGSRASVAAEAGMPFPSSDAGHAPPTADAGPSPQVGEAGTPGDAHEGMDAGGAMNPGGGHHHHDAGGSVVEEAGHDARTTADAGHDAASPATSDSGVTAPTQAAAAGFTDLVFDDEFTNASTLAPSVDSPSGYKWYQYASGTTGDYSVNTGAGTGAVAGATGILTITGSADTYNAVLQTVPWSATGATRAGTFQHGYFEARLQFSSKVLGNGGPSGGWPSFWLWATQAQSPVQGQQTAECDILEAYPNGTSGASTESINTLHNWQNSSTAGAVTDLANTENTNLQESLVGSSESAQPTDDAWHTYGCLWTSNGNGTGTVEFFYDNYEVVHQDGTKTFATGTGTKFPAMEVDNMYIILGTANSWPLNVDWVRVWQAP